MQPRMSEKELRLFESFLKCSNRYLEFGSGGSTCLAASMVRTSVTAVDSSSLWLQDVEKHCMDSKMRTLPNLFHVDIGPTGDWGYPTDPNTRAMWPTYHNYIWSHPAATNVDLCLIDGRFRVACFMQTILHANDDTVLIFHDYRSREHYHIVQEVAREVATSEDLSVFLPRKGLGKARAKEILCAYEFNYH